MVRNYVLVMLRTIMRQPSYFAINVIGLSIGLACCLLIYFYVKHEMSYDRFHSRLDRLYRINYDVQMGNDRTISPSVPVFVGPHVHREFPEIEQAVRFQEAYMPVAMRSGDDKMFEERGMSWADPNFFSVFDFPIVAGNVSQSFHEPNKIVITERMAQKYFGTKNPIGKTLTAYSNSLYEVIAVAADVPDNSTFKFTMVGSFASLKLNDNDVVWNNPNFATHLLLKSGTDVTQLQSKINNWVTPAEQRKANLTQLYLPLEPMREVHFNTSIYNFDSRLAITDLRYIYIFVIIAIIVLVIACINYINLATARAINRAKEVGIRKTTGVGRSQLIGQFLSESMGNVLPAVVLAMLMASAFMPWMNELLGKQIPIEMMNISFLWKMTLVWVGLAFLAGLYPALVLSHFKPITVLNGRISTNSGYGLRKSLVVAQFSISTFLILGTVVVMSQLFYMQDKKLGLDTEQVLHIRGNAKLMERLPSFINQIKMLPGVENASATWRSPFQTVSGNGLDLQPNSQNHQWVTVGGIAGDENFLNTLGISLAAGRNFEPAAARDSINEFLVNEAFLREFDFSKEEVLNQEFQLGLVGKGKVVGVVEDFHFSSLREKVQPAVIFNSREYQSGVLVRFNTAQISTLLSALEKEWKNIIPDRVFNYTFLDNQYENLYSHEQRISALTGIFSAIAIAIACLGLLGLASFTSLQRKKEISIRKVLGATSNSIIALLTGSYLKLIAIAFLVALPLSYFTLNKWLQDFAYRIDIGLWHYFISMILVLVVAWLTVGYQSFRASMENPTSGLRSE